MRAGFMKKTAIAAALWLLATGANAQDASLQAMQSLNDSRGWDAVGRLDIGGEGFCTAALIRDDLVLTAAHCVYGDDGVLLSPNTFEFNAGLRNGRAEAYRSVRRILAHPEYHHRASADLAEVPYDLAVLELAQPIRTSRIVPFEIAATPRSGQEIGVVSYAQDRAEAPSLQEVCSVIGTQDGFLVMSCDINFGLSGAPVFTLENGAPRIVSVISVMAHVGERKVSLGTALGNELAELVSSFDTPKIETNRLGNRNSTGAKFVRP